MIDEEALEREAQLVQEEIEAKRDATFEEFKAKYEDHIEGKAPNDRLDRVSNFGDDNKSTRSKSAKGGARGKSAASRGADDDDAEKKSQLTSSKSAKSGLAHQEEINRQFDEEKMALPETCFTMFPKSTKIEKLEAKYVLVAHPYPQVEGEMLIIQPKKDD